jgi:hypothetical protein
MVSKIVSKKSQACNSHHGLRVEIFRLKFG